MVKLFVGNLSFKTTDAELATQFSSAGKVVNAHVITRGVYKRSLGYGFVDFDTQEEAQKGLELLHRKEVDGRMINVELARDRPPAQPRQPRQPRAEGEEGHQDGASGESRGRGRGGRGRGRGGRGGRRGRGGRGAAQGEGQNDAQENNDNRSADHADNNNNANENRPRGRGRGGRGSRGGLRGRGRGGAQGSNGNEEGAQQGEQGGRPRGRGGRGRQGGRQVRRVTAEGPASKTTLFVANLPFSFTDDALKGLFSEFNPAHAHVVLYRGGKSRGFGFVEFSNEKDQQSALSTFDKRVVEGRDLAVRIAMSEARSNEGNNNNNNNSPAQQAAPAESAN